MAVKEILKDKPFIIVFDRGYPSIELIHFLEKIILSIYLGYHQMIIKMNVNL